jgi:hypothetical protein
VIPLLPVDLYEALDKHPDIARSERLLDVTALRHHDAAGSLKCSLTLIDSAVPPVLSLSFETSYAPHLYPDRVFALQDQIQLNILTAAPLLRTMVDDNSLALRIAAVPPGTLQHYPLKV